MKSKILLFLTLITYILTDGAKVTIKSVATGSCTNKKYTFVIKASTDTTLAAGSATVTLASPASTTPTCTYGAVTVTATGGGGTGTGTGTGTESRRLTDVDFDITCEITSKLDKAEIKVQSVAIASATVAGDTGVTFPVAMSGSATCEGTPASSDTTTPDGGKFIQISGFLFLLILTVF